MSAVDAATAVCLGIGLSAACGLRIFLPLLVASLALQSGWIDVPLSPEFAWMATPAAAAAFGIATLLEVGAYYVPWLDHLLDVAATPVAVIAGTGVTASFLGDLSPMMRWGTALVAGGGAAGTTQLLSVGARAASLATTGGLGNPLVSTLEMLSSLFLSVLAVLLPLLAVALVAILLLWALRRRRHGAAEPKT